MCPEKGRIHRRVLTSGSWAPLVVSVDALHLNGNSILQVRMCVAKSWRVGRSVLCCVMIHVNRCGRVQLYDGPEPVPSLLLAEFNASSPSYLQSNYTIDPIYSTASSVLVLYHQYDAVVVPPVAFHVSFASSVCGPHQLSLFTQPSGFVRALHGTSSGLLPLGVNCAYLIQPRSFGGPQLPVTVVVPALPTTATIHGALVVYDGAGPGAAVLHSFDDTTWSRTGATSLSASQGALYMTLATDSSQSTTSTHSGIPSLRIPFFSGVCPRPGGVVDVVAAEGIVSALSPTMSCTYRVKVPGSSAAVAARVVRSSLQRTAIRVLDGTHAAKALPLASTLGEANRDWLLGSSVLVAYSGFLLVEVTVEASQPAAGDVFILSYEALPVVGQAVQRARVWTQATHNDGTCACAKFCAQNWRGGLPTHWQGSQCVSARSALTNATVSCWDTSLEGLHCLCEQTAGPWATRAMQCPEL